MNVLAWEKSASRRARGRAGENVARNRGSTRLPLKMKLGIEITRAVEDQSASIPEEAQASFEGSSLLMESIAGNSRVSRLTRTGVTGQSRAVIMTAASKSAWSMQDCCPSRLLKNMTFPQYVVAI